MQKSENLIMLSVDEDAEQFEVSYITDINTILYSHLENSLVDFLQN